MQFGNLLADMTTYIHSYVPGICCTSSLSGVVLSLRWQNSNKPLPASWVSIAITALLHQKHYS